MRFKDKRRRHHHYQVTIVYSDDSRFARTYVDLEKAEAFAARQERSPVVKRTYVTKIK